MDNLSHVVYPLVYSALYRPVGFYPFPKTTAEAGAGKAAHGVSAAIPVRTRMPTDTHETFT